MKKNIDNLCVDWIVRDCFADAIAASSVADRIYQFHRGAGIFAFFKLLRSIREQRYDAVLDMQGLARSGVMAFAARSRRKIGRRDSRELSRIFYGEKIAPPESPHAIDILLQFLPKFGLEAKFEHALNFDAGKNFHRFPGRHVLLFPDSRRAKKQWPFFYELAEKLADAYPELQFATIGQNFTDLKFSHGNVENLAGETSLLDVLSLIKRCEVVVANDSAPMHIGAAMQRRVVALFGPTDCQKYGPYPLDSDRHTILSKRNLADLAMGDVFAACAAQINNFLRRC
jgi:ADP-heptose:LPS heptosyltransferase